MDDFAINVQLSGLDHQAKAGGKRFWHELQSGTGRRQVADHTGDGRTAWAVDPGMQKGLSAAELSALWTVTRCFHCSVTGNAKIGYPAMIRYSLVAGHGFYRFSLPC